MNLIQNQITDLIQESQLALCTAFEQCDGSGRFIAHKWERPERGGGTACILSDGNVFERAGINISAVYGPSTPSSIWQHRPQTKDQPYFATGLSMVIHPLNPYVPAFHANFRYFDAGDDWWFGGGMDLTPAYAFREDAIHFHSTLKNYCDDFDPAYYTLFKATCDQYFYIKHRKEMRGIGGIFFDYLHLDDGQAHIFNFMKAGLETILPAYMTLVDRRMATPFSQREREWQLYRRGRYVEFNLVYDRGTTFGLQTDGYVEAILMSLPPRVRWEFDHHPEPNSDEAKLAEFLQPQDWTAFSH